MLEKSDKISSDLAPVVLFVYNRPHCTLKTLEHLQQNVLADRSELFIYSDGPKPGATEDDMRKIGNVREIIKKEKWCREVHIIESQVNLGLATSIINGVTEIVNRYGKIIVLEDDLLASVHFLEYMNDGLAHYESKTKVFQIVGYTPPIKTKFKNAAFFLPISSTWGWGTWARAWKYFEKNPLEYTILKTDKKLRRKFDMENSYPYSDMLIRQMETGIDSWGIRWWWAVFKQQGIALFPDRTLVANMGFDDDASHTQKIVPHVNKFWINDYTIKSYPDIVAVNLFFLAKLKKQAFKDSHISVYFKIKRKLRAYLKRNYTV